MLGAIRWALVKWPAIWRLVTAPRGSTFFCVVVEQADVPAHLKLDSSLKGLRVSHTYKGNTDLLSLGAQSLLGDMIERIRNGSDLSGFDEQQADIMETGLVAMQNARGVHLRSAYSEED